MNLTDWGWDEGWEAAARESGGGAATDGIVPARVVADTRHLLEVVAREGVSWSRPTGNLSSRLSGTSAFPVTGDWVLVEARAEYTEWPLLDVLPRRSALSRRAPRSDEHKRDAEQVLAANVDYVFVVCGLDGGRNFTPRGLERYLTAAWESGALPVVVLNKADLAADPELALTQAREVAPGADVVATTTVTEGGLEALRPYLGPGKTVVLVGRSGVGKSSIVNGLVGEELLETRESREADRRGRHTTTLRRMLRLEGGAMLIDTPGLRAVGLWGDEESVDSSFPEIAELARGCRFDDCAHSGEPGCAVQQALADGALDPGRYESYLALQRELRYLARREDTRGRLEAKAQGKALSRHIKHWKRQSGKRN